MAAVSASLPRSVGVGVGTGLPGTSWGERGGPVYLKLPINAIIATAGDSILDTAPGITGLRQTVYEPSVWFNELNNSAFRVLPEYHQAKTGSDSRYMLNTALPALLAMEEQADLLLISLTNDVGAVPIDEAKANWSAVIAAKPAKFTFIYPIGEGSYWTPDELAYAQEMNAFFRSTLASNTLVVANYDLRLDDDDNTIDNNHPDQLGAKIMASGYIAAANMSGAYDVPADFLGRQLAYWDMTGTGGYTDGTLGGDGVGDIADDVYVFPVTGVIATCSKDPEDDKQIVEFSGTYTGDLDGAYSVIEVAVPENPPNVGDKSECAWWFEILSPTTAGVRSLGQIGSWYAGQDVTDQVSEVFSPPTQAEDGNKYNAQSAIDTGVMIIQRCIPLVKPVGDDMTNVIDCIIYHQVGVAQSLRIKIHGIYLASAI